MSAKRRSLSSLFAGVVIGAVLLSASGCGFHLRTYGFTGTLDSFALTGRTNLEVATAVRQQLRQAGIDEASPSEAALVLDFLDMRRERRSVSTSSGVRDAEYETTLAVRYRVLDGSGAELVAPTWIDRQRIYRVDRTNIVGTSEEQSILQRELLNDVAGQLIRVMETVSQRLQAGADAS